MYTSTYGQITKEFRCSQIVATLGLSLFVMGLGLGPMILSPLSEVLFFPDTWIRGLHRELVDTTNSSTAENQSTSCPSASS